MTGVVLGAQVVDIVGDLWAVVANPGGAKADELRQMGINPRLGYAVNLVYCSLCDRVREVCPELPGDPETIHWSIPDPTAGGADDEASYPAFQQTAAELETRIEFLLAVLTNGTPSS